MKVLDSVLLIFCRKNKIICLIRNNKQKKKIYFLLKIKIKEVDYVKFSQEIVKKAYKEDKLFMTKFVNS